MMTTRERLHELVDQLPADQLDAAKRALEQIAARPSFADILANAPLDDEAETPEEAAAAAAARCALAEGRVVSDSAIAAEFGPLGSEA